MSRMITFMYIPFSLLIFLYSVIGRNQSSINGHYAGALVPLQAGFYEDTYYAQRVIWFSSNVPDFTPAGNHLERIEKLLLSNTQDIHPSKLWFAYLINTIENILMWTNERLVLKAELKRYGSSGEADPNSTIITSNSTPPKYLTVDMPQTVDLSQWMLGIGALFNAAKEKNATPVLLQNYDQIKFFQNFTMEIMDAKKFAKKGGKYIKVPPQDLISSESGRRIQGWMNAGLSDPIKALLTFDMAIYNQSLIYIHDALLAILNMYPEETAFNQYNTSLSLPSLAGIYVQVDNTPAFAATEKRLLRAVLRLQRINSPLVFFVFSNNIAYCKELLTEPNFVFVENRTQEFEIATMSMLDYTILTEGLQGWMGAYMNHQSWKVYHVGNMQKDTGAGGKNLTTDGYNIFSDWHIFI